MDPEDVAQVSESLRSVLSADPTDTRRVVEEFGWADLHREDPDVAVRVLFELSGELLTTGSLLDEVMLGSVGDLADADVTRIVLPALGGVVPSGRRIDGDRIHVVGVVQDGAELAVVPTVRPDRRLELVECRVSAIDGDPLDASAGWRRVVGTVNPDRVLVSADHSDGFAPAAELWQQMLAAGRRALAHELVGVSGAMLRMTVDHVTSREQFGTALGSFQSVKHQLADVYLWREAALLAIEAAEEDPGPQSAVLAKTAAIRSSRTARAVCQQLLGGMGFTWEHDFHRYLRRALTIEPLLGGAKTLHGELGSALRSGAISRDLAAL